MAALTSEQRKERNKKIVEYISDNPRSTITEISKYIGISDTSIWTALLSIETNGMALFFSEEIDGTNCFSLFEREHI